jgi:putative alpha-1,2-mannosidase
LKEAIRRSRLRSKFSHDNEKAEPGYYSVKLDDDGILAEMTATKRVGFHRYTFPKTKEANIVIDLRWRDKLLDGGMYQVTPNMRRLYGLRRSSSWAKNQAVYFVADFSEPIRVASSEKKNVKLGGVEIPGNPIKLAPKFDMSTKNTLLVKVAVSYVSIEGAQKNLEAELPGWDFDKVRADAKAAWNKELSKIEVSGGTPDQTTTFYTALYHTMIHPNAFNDVDGQYKGHDGKIHSLRSGDTHVPNEGRLGPNRPRSVRRPGKPNPASPEEPANGDKSVPAPSEQYTVFSLWDTFRAAHPLYTIIDQKRTVDFINTFIRIYEQGGRLPVWELWGEETDTMIGYHAVSVIADAMAKGIKGFDYEKAYAAAETLRRTRSLRPRRLQKTRLHLDGGRERVRIKNT